jgi:hypothetical protein
LKRYATIIFVKKTIGKALSLAKRANMAIRGKKFSTLPKGSFHFTGQQASNIIKLKLSQDKPVFIARFGFVELDCTVAYLNKERPFLKNSFDFIRGEMGFFWEEKVFEHMSVNAGFFPTTKPMVEKFCHLMLKEAEQVDILGSWLKAEKFVNEKISHVIKIPISDIEPYLHQDPWSEVLEGKRVLVIHPFVDSIRSQYNNKSNLFADKRVLPDFDLKTIKAVQSIANNQTPFSNWFVALEHMKEEVLKTDFDIAIIGCGAYGFPLGAFVGKESHSHGRRHTNFIWNKRKKVGRNTLCSKVF